MERHLPPKTRRAAATTALVATAAAAAIACSAGKASPDPTAERASRIERGAYLVKIGACNDCHTPFKVGPNGPEPDMTRMLSGHPEGMAMTAPPPLPAGWGWIGSSTNTAFAGPWGISYAANLTPDMETGFGVYTEESFISAIRTGKHMGSGRPILPPMPWPQYRNFTDEDLKAIFAYLGTVPALRNKVPAPTPPGTQVALK